jgi:small-conductance mechanosensitive channel
MEKQMNKKSTIWLLIIVGLIVIAALAALWAILTLDSFSPPSFPSNPRPPPQFNPADLELYYIGRTVLSTVNIALLVFLIATYVALYSKTRSQFTIGLLLFASVFLVKDILSSPFVISSFRFQLAGLGPFALIEPLLEFIALLTLLYLSVKY